jgi:bacillithiol biosynthesis cysteine-adding enzyme BshC
MKLTHFPLSKTHQFSKFICNYVEQPNTISFLDATYFSWEYARKIIAEKNNFNPQNRANLVEILIHQNSFLTNSNEVFKNIEKLKKQNCFTITTAHQPCLFSGPIYTIIKAISAIKLCEEYKSNLPDYEFVPVFYIGSEDHDFEELNHINLFNKKIEWQSNQTGAVGSMSINGIEKLIIELETLFENEAKKDEIIALLKKCYQPQYTAAKAFRSLLHELLGKYGLIILDANEPQLKEKFTAIIKDELWNQNAYKLLNDEKWLANFDNNQLQITPREINLFYLDNQIRERIIFDNNKWKVNNTTI